MAAVLWKQQSLKSYDIYTLCGVRKTHKKDMKFCSELGAIGEREMKNVSVLGKSGGLAKMTAN